MQDIAAFLGPIAPDCSELSPLTCGLSGLPPLLIQVGSEEVLIDDAIALEKSVRGAGGLVELNIWPDMVHVWHLFPHYVEEADQAIAEIVAFLGRN
jgi:acetyl esterase/lipase